MSILNCTNLTTSELLSLNLVFSATGAVCLLISSFIVLLLIYYKAYHSVLQRLFLYLMLATMLREMGLFAVIEHHFHYKGSTKFVFGLHTLMAGLES